MRQKHLILALFLLNGCGPSMVAAPPSFISEWPPPHTMATPAKLPDVKEGEDLFDSTAQCSAAYVKETNKLVSLQRWVTVLKK